jgi:hypothetical protein
MKRARNTHHLHPKSRGGEKIGSNEILIYYDRHCAWHSMWDIRIPGGRRLPRTLKEIIILLKIVLVEDRFSPSPLWKTMWGDKTLLQVIKLLERVYRIKKHQEFYMMLN